MKRNLLKKITGILSCAALIACTIPPTASAASVKADQTAPEAYSTEDTRALGSPLTVETHLKARMGYPVAYYTVYLYAPSDVVAMQINDMPKLYDNTVVLTGSVGQTQPGTGGSTYDSITVKVTLYYSDQSVYTFYQTINVSNWCGGMHPITDHCTP